MNLIALPFREDFVYEKNKTSWKGDTFSLILYK